MTDISWLAALLSPRSVSPHGNFRSVDLVTPAGLLGLVAVGDERDRVELVDRLPQPLTTIESSLIEAASESLQLQTMPRGTERLLKVATDPDVPDAAMRVAAALFAGSFALSELDEPGRAVEMLEQVAPLIPSGTDDGRLLLGAVIQQQAMRACEAGVPYEHPRDLARDLLGAIDIDRVTRYPTSQGSRWPAAAQPKSCEIPARGKSGLVRRSARVPGRKDLKTPVEDAELTADFGDDSTRRNRRGGVHQRGIFRAYDEFRTQHEV